MTCKDKGVAESPGSSVSIVIPAFNEEASIPELLRRCLATCDGLGRPWEIILVDDGSHDATPDLIAAAAAVHPGKVIGVLLNRNAGQHAAVLAGMAQARGSIVVTLDADLQNPPEEIPRLVQETDRGFDVVGSVRTPRHDSPLRRVASRMVNGMARHATGVVMHDYGCMLRAYRRTVVDAMLQCGEVATFIPVLANSFARRTTEIAVRHAARETGPSKYGLWQLVNLQFDLLTAMTTAPLRVLSLAGLGMCALGFALGTLLLLLRLVHGPEWAAQGVFTLFAILFVFTGLQFVGMGLLGEYLARVHLNVRGRPRYIVRSTVGSSALPDRVP